MPRASRDRPPSDSSRPSPAEAGAYEYEGGELDLFTHARNWKAYFRSRIAAHVRGRVLEVGAGIGGTTRVLAHAGVRSWTCLEPDPALAARIPAAGPYPTPVEVVVGTLADLPADRRFDTILYIDVLEHVADDRAELARAVDRLADGGRVVGLCPAHPVLFTPFDAAIGHHRRYTARMFRDLTPPHGRCEAASYLDGVGLALSLANKLLLRQSMPTLGQVRFWDRAVVPCSRVVDRLTFGRVGKSVVGVWAKR